MNLDTLKLYSIVMQRPDRRLEVGSTECPFDDCRSQNVKICQTEHTLLDGDPDPNHWWIHCECMQCSRKFVKEHRRKKVWYTRDNKVIRGFPNCHESYIYTCVSCDGDVVRKFTDLDGKSDVKGVVCREDKNFFRTFYFCKACKLSVEIDGKLGSETEGS